MTQEMSCEEVLSKLFAYLDNEVGAPTDADIDAHLHECRECFSRVEFEKALKKKVAASAEATTPDDTRARMEALIRRF
jgi:mycothiol system anti-sigma-R factor